LGINHDIGPRDCPGFLAAVLDWLDHRPELHTVILSARWPYYATGTAYKNEAYPPIKLTDLWQRDRHQPSNAELFDRGLERMVQRLRAMRRDVVLVGAVPEVGYDVPAAYAIAARTGRDLNNLIAPTRVEYETRISDVRRSFDRLRHAYPIRVVNVAANLCDTLACHVVESNRILYRDDDHLSTSGSRSLAPLFYKIVDGR
jgi:hypothetical protein